jgi:cell wall assembly regulator SMI1
MQQAAAAWAAAAWAAWTSKSNFLALAQHERPSGSRGAVFSCRFDKIVTDYLEDALRLAEPHLPGIRRGLNGPASVEDIVSFEALIGQPLSEEFKRLYKRHNGQNGESLDGFAGFLYGIRWMPRQEARNSWMPSLSGPNKISPDNQVKPLDQNPRWIRFTEDGGGNHMAIDLDPGPSGTNGQVILIGPDEPATFVLALSLTHFLAWHAHQLGCGNLQINDKHGIDLLTTRWPGSEHYHDGYAAPSRQ